MHCIVITKLSASQPYGVAAFRAAASFERKVAVHHEHLGTAFSMHAHFAEAVESFRTALIIEVPSYKLIHCICVAHLSATHTQQGTRPKNKNREADIKNKLQGAEKVKEDMEKTQYLKQSLAKDAFYSLAELQAMAFKTKHAYKKQGRDAKGGLHAHRDVQLPLELLKEPLSGERCESGIPRIIHQTWKSKSVPLKFREYQRSWRELHPTAPVSGKCTLRHR